MSTAPANNGAAGGRVKYAKRTGNRGRGAATGTGRTRRRNARSHPVTAPLLLDSDGTPLADQPSADPDTIVPMIPCHPDAAHDERLGHDPVAPNAVNGAPLLPIDVAARENAPVGPQVPNRVETTVRISNAVSRTVIYDSSTDSDEDVGKPGDDRVSKSHSSPSQSSAVAARPRQSHRGTAKRGGKAVARPDPSPRRRQTEAGRKKRNRSVPESDSESNSESNGSDEDRSDGDSVTASDSDTEGEPVKSGDTPKDSDDSDDADSAHDNDDDDDDYVGKRNPVRSAKHAGTLKGRRAPKRAPGTDSDTDSLDALIDRITKESADTIASHSKANGKTRRGANVDAASESSDSDRAKGDDDEDSDQGTDSDDQLALAVAAARRHAAKKSARVKRPATRKGKEKALSEEEESDASVDPDDLLASDESDQDTVVDPDFDDSRSTYPRRSQRLVRGRIPVDKDDYDDDDDDDESDSLTEPEDSDNEEPQDPIDRANTIYTGVHVPYRQRVPLDGRLVKKAREGTLESADLDAADPTAALRIAIMVEARAIVERWWGHQLRGLPMAGPHSLLPHQVLALGWMQEREALDPGRTYGLRGGILSLRMGLGKTLVALAHTLMSLRGEFPTLVVCSKSVLHEWHSSGVAKFFATRGPDGAPLVRVLYLHRDFMGPAEIKRVDRNTLVKYDIVLTTYDVCLAECRKGDYSEECLERAPMPTTTGVPHGVTQRATGRVLVVHCRSREGADLPHLTGAAVVYGTPWERVICDESHRFANPSTALYRSMMAIYGRHKWCLTGTPIRNKHTDIWAQLRFLGYTGTPFRAVWTKQGPTLYGKHRLADAVLVMDHEHVEAAENAAAAAQKSALQTASSLDALTRSSLQNAADESHVSTTDSGVDAEGHKESGGEKRTDKKRFATAIPPLAEQDIMVRLSDRERVTYDTVLGLTRRTFNAALANSTEYGCVVAFFTRLRQAAVAPHVMTIAEHSATGADVMRALGEASNWDGPAIPTHLTAVAAATPVPPVPGAPVAMGAAPMAAATTHNNNNNNNNVVGHGGAGPAAVGAAANGPTAVQGLAHQRAHPVMHVGNPNQPPAQNATGARRAANTRAPQTRVTGRRSQQRTVTIIMDEDDDDKHDNGSNSNNKLDLARIPATHGAPQSIRDAVRVPAGSRTYCDLFAHPDGGRQTEPGAMGSAGPRDCAVDDDARESTMGPIAWCMDRWSRAGVRSAKMRAILRILKRIPKDEKVVVFSSFTSCLQLLADALKSRMPDIKVTAIEGETSKRDREANLRAFRNRAGGPRIMLMTYMVGSEGIDLTVANHCVCVEPWWTGIVHEQACARSWRMGQTRPVTVYNIIAEDTIDVRIMDMCRQKAAIADTYLAESERVRRSAAAAARRNANRGALDMATMARILGHLN